MSRFSLPAAGQRGYRLLNRDHRVCRARSWRRPPLALRPVLPPDRRLNLCRSNVPGPLHRPPVRVPRLAPL